MPATADDVCEFAFMGMIRKPGRITVRTVTGEKYPEIVKYELGPSESEERIAEMKESGEWDEDIPF